MIKQIELWLTGICMLILIPFGIAFLILTAPYHLAKWVIDTHTENEERKKSDAIDEARIRELKDEINKARP